MDPEELKKRRVEILKLTISQRHSSPMFGTHLELPRVCHFSLGLQNNNNFLLN